MKNRMNVAENTAITENPTEKETVTPTKCWFQCIDDANWFSTEGHRSIKQRQDGNKSLAPIHSILNDLENDGDTVLMFNDARLFRIQNKALRPIQMRKAYTVRKHWIDKE